jgi:hypothetical protein
VFFLVCFSCRSESPLSGKIAEKEKKNKKALCRGWGGGGETTDDLLFFGCALFLESSPPEKGEGGKRGGWLVVVAKMQCVKWCVARRGTHTRVPRQRRCKSVKTKENNAKKGRRRKEDESR